ncbi:hypothetical protein AMAG_18448 [Allomyces macrogynus ATCC 38327]|uniref:Uncharacterized protein n=1 Tax=Allomyces macrogynus (strain ATCC 38327) TaxID=578462 RepID=A0A0L0SC27_ALLM3|nr:hypothetical protein AMAG_18448 [Allomyces macrogynus ATCC 38327]|eukprot:KNE59959.1 hypothetical protein AMAG_18448 [Allomyces macrogynus ATCC 38327]
MTDVAAETFVAPTAAAEPVVEAVAEPVAAPAPAPPAATPAVAAPVTADRGLAEVLGFSFVKGTFRWSDALRVRASSASS